MDTMGIVALIVGLILCAIGGLALWSFLPEVIVVIKGLVGIILVLVGIMLAVFGILIVND